MTHFLLINELAANHVPQIHRSVGLVSTISSHIHCHFSFSARLYITVQRTTAQSLWCPLERGGNTGAPTRISPSAEASCPAVAGRSRSQCSVLWTQLLRAILSVPLNSRSRWLENVWKSSVMLASVK